jgi:multisubunit Na+/H+ antiporter MnhB subunit
VKKLFVVFGKTLQFAYLFGIVPALMIGAIDDILFHVRRISPLLRMLLLAVIGFAASSLLYGSRGPDTGVTQFVLYGLVGMAPAMLSSWLAHIYADAPQAAHST